MKFDPKISLDKSWEFTPRVLILIALGIVVILGTIIFWKQGQQLEQPPVSLKEPSIANPQIPQGSIWGINATIITIEKGKASRMVLSLRSDLGQIYSANINTDTPIFRLSRTFTETEVQSTRERATINDLKIGIRIYLQSKSNLLKTFELSPKDIKSIDIYVD